VIDYIYNHLGLPTQRQRGEESPTGNEVALRKLLLKAQHQVEHPMRRHTPKPPLWKREPQLAVDVLTLILDHREKAKLATYLDPSKIDADGRMRCMYKVTTENGRLASRSNPFGTGQNLQNIPRGELREVFIPDKDCVFIEADYSQSESRIVKVLSKDPASIAEARLLPAVFDEHTAAAKRAFAVILNVPEADVDVEVEVTPGNTRRQIFKPFNHGGAYGAHAARVQEMMLKDGILLPLKLCEQLLDAAITRPKRDYQRETRKRIMRERALTNSWGRTLSFEGDRLDDGTYRRGYAFRAASENADNLNQLGLVPTHTYIVERRLKSRINCQVHDSLLLSCPPNEVYDVARFVIKSMERPRTYEGVELAVPVGLKMGTSWKCEREWKALPSRAELEGAAHELLRERKTHAKTA
jgi:DNA polymerase-1